jgi:chitodextrinase
MAAATGAFNTQATGLLYTARASAAPAPAPAPAPSPAPAPAPSCSAPDWNSTTRYMPGDTVMRNGTMYVATDASATAWNVNSPPEWTPSYWSVATTCAAPAPAPAPSPAPAPAPSCSAPEWGSTTRYMPGDRVTRLGTLYVARDVSASVWNVNSPPEWTPDYWATATCS